MNNTLNSTNPASVCLSVQFDWNSFEALTQSLFSPAFQRGYRLVNQMCLQLCFKVVERYRLFADTPPLETMETMASKIGLAPQARYLLECIMALLVEEQYLASIDRSWIALRPIGAPDMSSLYQRANEQYRGEPMFELIACCEHNLFDFLEGKKSGIEAIFPMGDSSLWSELHYHSLFLLPYNKLAAFLVTNCSTPGATILEIGAGTGASTAQVLAKMEKDAIVRYIYTDVSAIFLQRGHRRFGQHQFMTFQVYDLNVPPLEQGLAASSVDIIFGVNVLHVAYHLPTSLKYIRTLLKPNGWLIISEGSPRSSKRVWRPSLLFGFLEGWWNVKIDPNLRPQPGFLMPSKWQGLFKDAGLVGVCALPGEEYFKEDCYGGVVIGQEPEEETYEISD